MCWMCDEYGDPNEGGGIWYLNPKNYARNMYKLRAPGEGVAKESWGTWADRVATGPTLEDLIEAMDRGNPEEIGQFRDRMEEGFGQENQVVPLQDAEKMLELAYPIGLIGCVCRRRDRAIDERNEMEYTCMGLGVGMLKWERWPERYKGGVKFVNVEEAKEWVRLMNRRGFCHILMLYGAPYIGGFCMCDYPDCDAVRNAVDFGIGVLKGHYVAQVDYDICNGCGICAQRCQWGALKFEATSEKANIDQFKCYGCGLCETGCPRGAISLVKRSSLPTVANVWH